MPRLGDGHLTSRHTNTRLDSAVDADADAAGGGPAMNHELLDAVGHLSLIWESSMTLGAFIADKVGATHPHIPM